MEKTMKVMKSSELYKKIEALPLAAAEREEAANALRMAEMLTDAFYGLGRKLGLFGAWLNPHPKFKPE